MRVFATFAVLMSVAAPGLARAQAIQAPGTTLSAMAPSVDRPDAATMEQVSYPEKILLTDGAGVVLVVAGALAESQPVTTAGFVVMGFGPAVVHASEGNVTGAVGSALLRPGLVTAGLMLGAASAHCADDDRLFCGLGEALVGGLVGYGAAVVIDAAVLARTTRARPARVTPRVAATSTGFQVGLAGSF